MSEQKRQVNTTRKLGRISLGLCVVFFLVFLANVLIGKAKLIFALPDIPLFSDVAEYLLLMATALFFSISALMSERMEESNRETGPNRK